jgi:quercetin dioxygenase-like cupin family protein
MEKVEFGYSVAPHAHQPLGTRHLAGPLLRLDLQREIVDLRAGDAFIARGHAAKTLAKHADLRLVLLAFREGARLAEHCTKGRLSIQVLDGQVVFQIGRERIALSAGELLTMAPSIAHDISAPKDCAILLTIAWPQ